MFSAPIFPDRPFSRSFDVNSFYERQLRAINKKPWDRHMGVYHPSSLGSPCDRALYYDRIGVQPVPCVRIELMAIFELGHALHERIQMRLHGGSKRFQSEVKVNIPLVHLAGSCDGVFEEEGWILEIKGISKDGFSRLTRPHPEHILQVTSYMVGLGLPRAQILYVNRDSGARRMFTSTSSNGIGTRW